MATASLAELLAQYSLERGGHVGRLIDDFFRECLELFTADKLHLPFALLELFLELGILEHFGEAVAQDLRPVRRVPGVETMGREPNPQMPR